MGAKRIGRLGAACLGVWLLGACSGLVLIAFQGPSQILAGTHFELVIAGTGAVGGLSMPTDEVGAVLQIPNGVQFVGATASSKGGPILSFNLTIDDPMILALYSPEPNHHLVAISGAVGQHPSATRISRVELRAPDGPTNLTFKVGLARKVGATWMIDGTPSSQFSMITDPRHLHHAAVVTAPDSTLPRPLWLTGQDGAGIPASGKPRAFDRGNIDGDGRDDIIYSAELASTGAVQLIVRLSRPGGVWVNGSAGVFAPLGNFSPNKPALGDFNGDGLADLVTPLGHVFLRGPNGTWSAPQSLSPLNAVTRAITGDVDGDGFSDIAFLAAGSLHVFQSQGGTSFLNIGVFTPAGGLTFAGDLRFEDIDSDGDHEIIVDHGGLMFLDHQGGMMTMVQPLGATQTVSEAAAADLNGDGIAELIVVTSNIIGVHPGLGGNPPTFGLPVVISPPSIGALSNPQVADFNGDGFLDLVVVERLPIPLGISGVSDLFQPRVFAGTLGGFTPTDIGPEGLLFHDSQAPKLTIGDFNGDGRPDLLSRSGGLGPVIRHARPAANPILDGTATADTVLVNGSNGGVNRLVTHLVGQSLAIDVVPMPGSITPPWFALWGTLGPLTLLEVATGPFGPSAFPAEVFQAADPRLFTLTNGLWSDSRALAPATPAPWSLPLPSGLPFPTVFSLQGLMVDTGNSPPIVALSNAITVDIR